MGKLAGFRYRKVVKSLKHFGFTFDRQAAGSHEIWRNSKLNRYTTIPNHPGDTCWFSQLSDEVSKASERRTAMLKKGTPSQMIKSDQLRKQDW